MEGNGEISGVVQMGEENLKAAEKRLGTDLVIAGLIETASVAGLWLAAQGARAVEAGNQVNDFVMTMGVEAINVISKVSPAAYEVLNQGKEMVADFLAANPNALVDATLVGAGVTITGWAVEQISHDVDVRQRAASRLEKTKQEIVEMSERMKKGLPGWFEQRNGDNANLKSASEQVAVEQLLAMKAAGQTGGETKDTTTGQFPVKDFTNSKY